MPALGLDLVEEILELKRERNAVMPLSARLRLLPATVTGEAKPRGQRA